jgi:hypothetical protein
MANTGRIDAGLLRGVSSDPCACAAGGEASVSPNKDQAAGRSLAEAPRHEHGAIAIDLDEAVHGVYAAIKQGLSANSHESPSDDLSLLNRSALDVLPAGTADAALSLAAGAMVLPLAGLAVKGGIRECKQAGAMVARLRTEKQRYRQQERDMQRLFGQPTATTLTKLEMAADAVRLKGFRNGVKTEKNTCAIGISSAASGATIGLKSAADIGMTVGFGIKSALNGQGFAQAAQAVSSGAGVGVAGAFALASAWVMAPLAGLFATTLGAFMLHKTRTHRARLKSAFQVSSIDLQASLARMRNTGTQHVQFQDYVAFISAQGETRLNFLRKFKRWNTAFVAGSGLYAASAVAKAVIVGVAAAGLAGALSNPIGAGILLGVGLAGALVMFVGSIAFFTGHDKQNRYARSAYLDHHQVDRHLIALDLMNYSSDRGAEEALAPKLLEFIKQRSTGLLSLLDQCANQMGRIAKHSPHHSVWKRLQGKSLKPADIEIWLKSNGGRDALIEFIKADLQAQCSYLRHKLEHRLKLIETHIGALQIPDADDPSPLSAINPIDETIQVVENETSGDLIQAMARYFGMQDNKLEQDQIQLESCRQLLKRLNNEPAISLDDSLSSLIGEHLLPGHGISTGKALARHLYGEILEDQQSAKDCLFDAQLDSTRIKVKVCPMRTHQQ